VIRPDNETRLTHFQDQDTLNKKRDLATIYVPSKPFPYAVN